MNYNMVNFEDYMYKKVDTTVTCDLEKKRGTYESRLIIKKLSPDDVTIDYSFEEGSECENLSAISRTHENEIKKLNTAYDGTNYYKAQTIILTNKIPENQNVEIKLRFSRNIEVKNIEPFFNMNKIMIGLFDSLPRKCDNFIQTVKFKTNGLPIRSVENLSAAKATPSKDKTYVVFERNGMNRPTFTAMTLIVEEGNIYKAQSRYHWRWTLRGASLGFVLSLFIYVFDKLDYFNKLITIIGRLSNGK